MNEDVTRRTALDGRWQMIAGPLWGHLRQILLQTVEDEAIKWKPKKPKRLRGASLLCRQRALGK
jgi:hypothetical protein